VGVVASVPAHVWVGFVRVVGCCCSVGAVRFSTVARAEIGSKFIQDFETMFLGLRSTHTECFVLFIPQTIQKFGMIHLTYNSEEMVREVPRQIGSDCGIRNY
jgi:hypothetical protein